MAEDIFEMGGGSVLTPLYELWIMTIRHFRDAKNNIQ